MHIKIQIAMKIIVNMACGLANRMFQYSYYLYLKNIGYNASVDYYQSAQLRHEHVEWNRIFPLAKLNQASRWEIFCLGGGEGFISKVRRKYIPFLHHVIQQPTAFAAEIPPKDKGNKYIMGVFQNANIVDKVKEEVQQIFTFAPFEDKRNKALQKEMQACNSIGIHIRKGKDYMTRIWYQETCPLEYYRDAIAYIKRRVESPKLYVFADNPEWVKEHFNEFDYTLVEGNPPAGWGSHFDMQLMSCCKHNIISNSTYSWWGAFLNQNPEKIVILPHQWFNPQSCEESTCEKIQCEGWVAL